MSASSARPEALIRFGDQLTAAADAVRPTLGQLRDALAQVDAACIDHHPDLPPVVEMTADVVRHDHELAAHARQVGSAFVAADGRPDVPLLAGAGAGGGSGSGGGGGGDSGASDTTTSEHGPTVGVPAISVLLSLPDVDRIVRDGNPIHAWHDKGVAYAADWAALVADSATVACQTVHNPYVCIGAPALRFGSNLVRWWASNGRIPGTDVRSHDIQAGAVSAARHGGNAVTDVIDDSEDAVETTLNVSQRAATSAMRAGEGALHRGERAVEHLANEGSKLAHEGLRAAERIAHDYVPDLGIGFG